MWLDTLAPMFFFLSLATILQTLSGFGFGLLVVSSFTLFNLMPLTATTFVVSVLGLINSVAIVARHTSLVNRRAFTLILALGLPFMALGFALLEFLSNGMTAWLNILLGLAILACCCLLIFRRSDKAASGKGWGFAAAGAIGGLLGGMFSTFGPPVVFQCYRQSWSVNEIRFTLLAVFSVSALLRVVMVPFGTLPDTTTLITVAATIPLVMVCTWLGKVFAAKVQPEKVRMIALLMLSASGISLISKNFAAILI